MIVPQGAVRTSYEEGKAVCIRRAYGRCSAGRGTDRGGSLNVRAAAPCRADAQRARADRTKRDEQEGHQGDTDTVTLTCVFDYTTFV